MDEDTGVMIPEPFTHQQFFQAVIFFLDCSLTQREMAVALWRRHGPGAPPLTINCIESVPANEIEFVEKALRYALQLRQLNEHEIVA